MDEADELLLTHSDNLNDITPPAILRFTSSEVSETNNRESSQDLPGNFEPKDLVDSACLLTSEENSNIDNSSKMAEISINDVLCYPDHQRSFNPASPSPEVSPMKLQQSTTAFSYQKRRGMSMSTIKEYENENDEFSADYNRSESDVKRIDSLYFQELMSNQQMEMFEMQIRQLREEMAGKEASSRERELKLVKEQQAREQRLREDQVVVQQRLAA